MDNSLLPTVNRRCCKIADLMPVRHPGNTYLGFYSNDLRLK